jgi:hypothetical protein
VTLLAILHCENANLGNGLEIPAILGVQGGSRREVREGREGLSRHKRGGSRTSRGAREGASASFSDEIARPSAQTRAIGAGLLYHRRRGLRADPLVKLEAGVRLGDEVPVRRRFESIVPARAFGQAPGSQGTRLNAACQPWRANCPAARLKPFAVRVMA